MEMKDTSTFLIWIKTSNAEVYTPFKKETFNGVEVRETNDRFVIRKKDGIKKEMASLPKSLTAIFYE